MAKLCIDGNKLLELLSEQLVKETGAFSKGVNKGLNISRSLIRNPDAVKPIDPENLPIVRKLREELARVTAERDDYKELFFSYRNVCGGHDPQRISELVEADKAGKAIILPIKPGEMAYVIADREILPFHIGNIAVEEWGMSFEGSIEGIGPHRTGPYEKVYFSMEEARAILMKIMVKKYLDYGGDRGGVI